MLEFLKSIDTQVLLFVNGHNSPFWDSVMWQISGKYLWLPLYLGLLAYIVYKFKKQSWIIFISIALVILMSDQIASHLIKNLAERLRPTHEASIKDLIHIVKGYTGGKFGFVSSHASNTFGLAIFLTLLFKKKWFGCFILIWAAIVSFSRIYLGVHYPGDILGGAIVGLFSGAFVYWLLLKISKHYNLKVYKQIQDVSTRQ
jgi:undecaprenyl-diphosphatase